MAATAQLLRDERVKIVSDSSQAPGQVAATSRSRAHRRYRRDHGQRTPLINLISCDSGPQLTGERCDLVRCTITGSNGSRLFSGQRCPGHAQRVARLLLETHAVVIIDILDI